MKLFRAMLEMLAMWAFLVGLTVALVIALGGW